MSNVPGRISTNLSKPFANPPGAGLSIPRAPRTTRLLQVVGMVGFMGGAVAACGSSDNKTPNASGGQTGSSTGGSSGGQAGVTGGAGTGSGSSGGSGGSSTAPRADGGAADLPPVKESGMAVGKFCNLLVDGMGQNVEFTLEIGTKKVTFKAISDSCTPIKGMPCTAISGGDVPVRLSAKGMLLLEGVWQGIEANTEVLFLATIDDTSQQLDLQGGAFKPAVKCNTVDLDTLFPPGDGGASDSGIAPPPRMSPANWLEGARLAPLEGRAGFRRIGPALLPGKWREARR
jgi:hypothetical protein